MFHMCDVRGRAATTSEVIGCMPQRIAAARALRMKAGDRVTDWGCAVRRAPRRAVAVVPGSAAEAPLAAAERSAAAAAPVAAAERSAAAAAPVAAAGRSAAAAGPLNPAGPPAAAGGKAGAGPPADGRAPG